MNGRKNLLGYKNDPDKSRLIGLAFKRPKLYNKYNVVSFRKYIFS